MKRTQNLGGNSSSEQPQLSQPHWGLLFVAHSSFHVLSRGQKKHTATKSPPGDTFTRCSLWHWCFTVSSFTSLTLGHLLSTSRCSPPPTARHTVFLREGYSYSWDKGTVIPLVSANNNSNQYQRPRKQGKVQVSQPICLVKKALLACLQQPATQREPELGSTF